MRVATVDGTKGRLVAGELVNGRCAGAVTPTHVIPETPLGLALP